jgi:hypothetical protein
MQVFSFSSKRTELICDVMCVFARISGLTCDMYMWITTYMCRWINQSKPFCVCLCENKNWEILLFELLKRLTTSSIQYAASERFEKSTQRYLFDKWIQELYSIVSSFGMNKDYRRLVTLCLISMLLHFMCSTLCAAISVCHYLW